MNPLLRHCLDKLWSWSPVQGTMIVVEPNPRQPDREVDASNPPSFSFATAARRRSLAQDPKTTVQMVQTKLVDRCREAVLQSWHDSRQWALERWTVARESSSFRVEDLPHILQYCRHRQERSRFVLNKLLWLLDQVILLLEEATVHEPECQTALNGIKASLNGTIDAIEKEGQALVVNIIVEAVLGSLQIPRGSETDAIDDAEPIGRLVELKMEQEDDADAFWLWYICWTL